VSPVCGERYMRSAVLNMTDLLKNPYFNYASC
jgi:hypothetical protein